MIRKSGDRFSEQIMLKTGKSMIRKSGDRFSERIMRKYEYEIMGRLQLVGS